MKTQITAYLSRYADFDEKETEEFFACLQAETFAKKEFILKEGEVCKYKFFIRKGLVRSFYYDEKGVEKILQFGIENWWVTNIESFTKETPSHLYIQALEETEVWMISRADLEGLFRKHPKFERLFRKIAENMLIALQRRYGFYMKMSSKERYANLVSSIPDFVQRVPQYMIASYLEISPEYLSELRKTSRG